MEAGQVPIPPEEAAPETAPQTPQVDHPPETPEEAQALAKEFAAYRAEVAALRKELTVARVGTPAVTTVATLESPEDRLTRRLEAIKKHTHYCPGCGSLFHNEYRQCTGSAERPHAPIDVVSTDELVGDNADPANHTPAPAFAT